jgi:hypothetical protein
MSGRREWPKTGLLRRSFALDVLACVKCGGKRRVLYIYTPSYEFPAIFQCFEAYATTIQHTY